MALKNPARKIATIAIAFVANLLCCSIIIYIISELGPDTTTHSENGMTTTSANWKFPFLFLLSFTGLIMVVQYALYYLCIFLFGKSFSLGMRMILVAVALFAAFFLIVSANLNSDVNAIIFYLLLAVFGASIPLFYNLVNRRMQSFVRS